MERNEIQKRFDKLPGMNCFACAPHELNPHGLKLIFEETEAGARTQFELPHHFQSYPHFLHGGVLSTVVDESMFYAAAFKLKVIAFTRNLQISFRNAGRPGETYVCDSRVTEHTSGSFKANATVRSADRGVIVRATAEFAVPSAELAARLLGKETVALFLDFFPEGKGLSEPQ